MFSIKFPLCHFNHMSSDLLCNRIYITSAWKISYIFYRKSAVVVSLVYDHSSNEKKRKHSNDKFSASFYPSNSSTTCHSCGGKFTLYCFIRYCVRCGYLRDKRQHYANIAVNVNWMRTLQCRWYVKKSRNCRKIRHFDIW
jgi:hypothetical protein